MSEIDDFIVVLINREDKERLENEALRKNKILWKYCNEILTQTKGEEV